MAMHPTGARAADPMPDTFISPGQKVIRICGPIPAQPWQIAELLRSGDADVVVANGYEHHRGSTVITRHALCAQRNWIPTYPERQPASRY